MAGGAAARKPANSGWSSGKATRLQKGLAQTGARSRSASATAAGPAPSASTSGPITSTGLRAAASAAAQSASSAGSGAMSWLVRRGGSGRVGAAQSSLGMETKVGPKGRCMATWKACAMAAGTSAARAGSQDHLT